MPSIHYLSLSAVKIETFGLNGIKLETATAFFHRNQAEELFLVTNWHVVTCRSPFTPASSQNGAIPEILRFSLPVKTSADRVNLSSTMNFEIALNSADGNDPRWLEHPNYRHTMDVVAIPMGNWSAELNLATYHTVDQYQNLEPRYEPKAMDDVHVIGYPWGLSSRGGLPIYKRGSVASDPVVPQNGLPRFLIDCRTADGMSGSPVMVTHSGVWDPDNTSGQISENTEIGTVECFAGVYSGRLTSDIEQCSQVSEIGAVWWASHVYEILESGCKGSTLDELAST